MAALQPLPAPDNIKKLPVESIIARTICTNHSASVVRLAVPKRSGRATIRLRGTGFIVHRGARDLLVLTCAHSFEHWAADVPVSVCFHDNSVMEARVCFIQAKREVALLSVDISTHPNASIYPQVNLSRRVPIKGDLVVMLGFPTGATDPIEIAHSIGSVTNEPTLMGKSLNTPADEYIELFASDCAVDPGASGAPIFNTDGEVVGILASGSEDMCYAVSVNWIESSLKDTDEVKRAGLVNASIMDMFRSCFATADQSDATGPSGATTSSRTTRGA